MKKTGFTVIELLLVLSIIGIIAAVAIPAVLDQKQRSKQRKLMTVEAMIKRNGPPDRLERISDSSHGLSFAYYKQPDGTTIVYTIKSDRIIGEAVKAK